jgi:hypothetical protein
MEIADYEAMLDSRNLPHGTTDQVRSHIAQVEAAGVGRFYIQVYAALSDIDTEDVGRIYRALDS